MKIKRIFIKEGRMLRRFPRNRTIRTPYVSAASYCQYEAVFLFLVYCTMFPTCTQLHNLHTITQWRVRLICQLFHESISTKSISQIVNYHQNHTSNINQNFKENIISSGWFFLVCSWFKADRTAWASPMYKCALRETIKKYFFMSGSIH